MVNLDIRLKAVYDMVGKSESVLDVGSDHGYLPIQLFKNNMNDARKILDIIGDIKKNSEELLEDAF